MKNLTIISGFFVGAGLLLAVSGQAGAQWRYIDDKGKSHTVTLKMDVPRQYSHTAVRVDAAEPREPVGRPQPTPPDELSEQAAARQAWALQAANLRYQAAQVQQEADRQRAALPRREFSDYFPSYISRDAQALQCEARAKLRAELGSKEGIAAYLVKCMDSSRY